MQIESLKIQNLRNIIDAELKPASGLNFFIGPNGAGKTTLLESIYLLARARSFRPSQNRNLINQDSKELIIFSELNRCDGSICKIGLRKDKKQTQIKRDGNPVSKLSELAHTLPLTVITPNIQRIIEEGPDHRRKLLNWGLFHVEQSYGQLVMRYAKTLNQRNSALAGSKNELSIWTSQLSDLGESIASKQRSYLKVWNQSINELLSIYDIDIQFEIGLAQGWHAGMRFEDALNEHYSTDRERGFTSVGPHRMDIKVTAEGRAIKHDYSRGQKKIIAILMLLAQATILRQHLNEPPVLLVDDLQSELDARSHLSMLDLITSLNLQSFITSLDANNLPEQSGSAEMKLFHVEQGTVNQG